MEITSIPYLDHEDYGPHSLFAIFQDTESSNCDAQNPKKRRRNPINGDLKDILSSLILFDDKNQTPQDQIPQNYPNPPEAQLISDPSMLNFQSHLPNFDPSDSSSPPKRPRRSPSVEDSTTSGGDAGAGTSGVGNGGRRLWVKDRSKAWWEKCIAPDFPEEEFRRGFRMSRATFEMICEELDAAVTKKDTMLRAAIPVRQRVAVCIWRLATGDPLRLVSKRFGLGISTCHKLVLEVCSAIRTVLMPKFLQWPQPPGLSSIQSRFLSLSGGVPGVAGALYTTHIPIIAPKHTVAAYFNRAHTERNQKTSYSMTLQGVVDHRGLFTDVCIGWPGSMRDDQVVEKSALCQRAARGLLRDVWIAGKASHPLLDWLLVPYSHQNLTWSQHAFNERLGAISGVAREAFQRLKRRWACLQKRTEVKLQDLPVVLGACCVLHNICEMRNEEVDPELRFENFDDEMVAENAVRSPAAAQARDHIAHNLLHHGGLGAGPLLSFDT